MHIEGVRDVCQHRLRELWRIEDIQSFPHATSVSLLDGRLVLWHCRVYTSNHRVRWEANHRI